MGAAWVFVSSSAAKKVKVWRGSIAEPCTERRQRPGRTCKVQVGRRQKAKAGTSNCVYEGCKKGAGEERMLPKHPCARKLREANATKSVRVQEDCEKQVEAITKANTANVTVCEKAAKARAHTGHYVQDDCKKAGRERMLLKHGPCEGRRQKLNTAKSDHVQDDCEERTLLRVTVCKRTDWATMYGTVVKSECCRRAIVCGKACAGRL